eukprot:696077-Pyramimonas_sp.AAC.1
MQALVKRSKDIYFSLPLCLLSPLVASHAGEPRLAPLGADRREVAKAAEVPENLADVLLLLRPFKLPRFLL